MKLLTLSLNEGFVTGFGNTGAVPVESFTGTGLGLVSSCFFLSAASAKSLAFALANLS